MQGDVTRTYFDVEASRNMHVMLPIEGHENGEKQMCGKLCKAMYGTRDVAKNWQRKCSEVVKDIGFTIGKVWRCHYYNRTRTCTTWCMATTS